MQLVDTSLRRQEESPSPIVSSTLRTTKLPRSSVLLRCRTKFLLVPSCGCLDSSCVWFPRCSSRWNCYRRASF